MINPFARLAVSPGPAFEVSGCLPVGCASPYTMQHDTLRAIEHMNTTLVKVTTP